MKCTWEGCREPATHPQLGKTGEAWANLCTGHDRELASRMSDVRGILSGWVKAQGGAKAAAERM